MSYKMKKQLANKANYGSQRSTSTIKYIVIHYTANDGDTDENNGKYFANNIVKASAHYFVDSDSVTQSVPDNYVAWSVGVNYGSNNLFGIVTNSNSISIELCDDYRNGKIYPTKDTIENAIALTKSLMKKYNIPAKNVVRHWDVCSKRCPAYWVDDKKWKAEFHNKLGSSTTSSTSTKKTTKYTYKKFVKDVQSAMGVKVTGEADSKLLSKVVTVSKTLNSKHAVVKPIQKYLNELGYSCGKADGIAGDKFENGAKKFQKAKGLKADGIVGKNTWKKLLKL